MQGDRCQIIRAMKKVVPKRVQLFCFNESILIQEATKKRKKMNFDVNNKASNFINTYKICIM